jgi:hypothetical protein
MMISTVGIRKVATALLLLGVAALVVGIAKSVRAQSTPSWGPKWTVTGELLLPENYHHWVYLGSPLTPHALNGGEAAFPEFHNVYTQPEAFAAYQATGEWPEGTIMFKELQLVRPSMSSDGSSIEVSGRGYFPGARNGADVSVKDSARFQESDGWGFFNFGHHAPPYLESAAAQPVDACAGCHIANATNMVFTKFYDPILKAK